MLERDQMIRDHFNKQSAEVRQQSQIEKDMDLLDLSDSEEDSDEVEEEEKKEAVVEVKEDSQIYSMAI